MRKPVAILGLILAAGAGALAAQSSPYFVRDGMATVVDPSIVAIWDMQVEVMDDYGNFNPDLMTEDSWATLAAHARTLDAEATAMASATTYAIANPTGELPPLPEGTDLAAIEARIQANPEAFRALSRSFAGQTSALVAAADARDAEQVSLLVNDMQPQCGGCHEVFWFPTVE